MNETRNIEQLMRAGRQARAEELRSLVAAAARGMERWLESFRRGNKSAARA